MFNMENFYVILHKILIISGIFLILGIIFILGSYSYKNIFEKTIIKTNHKEYILVSDSLNSKFTSTDAIDEVKAINENLEKRIKELNELESRLNKIEDRNKTDFRLILTLLGSVFAIVGFFGFKSIFDTRQNAVDKAVYEGKKAAEKEAEKTAKETAKLSINELAPRLVKAETESYLNNNLKQHFDRIEKNVVKDYINDIEEIKKEIDILKNPKAFSENIRPQFINNIENGFKELHNNIEKYKAELDSFKNKEFKKNIINEIQKGIDDKAQ